MIVVTFALPAESSTFVRRLKCVKRDGEIVRAIFGHRARSGPSPQSSPPGRGEHEVPGEGERASSDTDAAEIFVVHTGVGGKECRKRLSPFLANEQPRLLISSGFCGGTSDEVSLGDLLVAENYSETRLAQKVKEALAAAILGKFFSADEVIDPVMDRYAIGREHGAMAIDMETATIARMCAAKNIPMLGLRVVSDSPGRPFPAPPDVLFDIEEQRTKFSRLLPHIARNPAAAMRLMKFSRQIASAREILAEALCAVISVL